MTVTYQRRQEAKALTFLNDNPHVMPLFDMFTRQVIAAGFEKYSARAIFHRIRWHAHIETNDPDFKINNNHSPTVARLWMAKNPQYPDFFERRQEKTEFVAVRTKPGDPDPLSPQFTEFTGPPPPGA